MSFHEMVQQLHEKIDEWAADVGRELNLTDLPQGMLSHLMESNQPVKIRDHQKVMPGFYQTPDGSVQVRVVSQDMSTGQLVLETTGESEDERFQTMSPAIFQTLFEQTDSGAYQKAELVEIIKTNDALPDAVQKQHQKERSEGFTWSAITAAHGRMAERYTQLYHSVLQENKEEAKTDYLEFLFLAFVLGARLGFSPRHDFHALYIGVFSLSDRTQDQCQLTQDYYNELMVETTTEVYKLYDPILEQAPPVCFYVVVSTKDQVGLDNVEYPKGCFLPSHAAVSKLLYKN